MVVTKLGRTVEQQDTGAVQTTLAMLVLLFSTSGKNILYLQNKEIITVPPVSHIVVYERGDIISAGGGDCDCEGQRATLCHHRCGVVVTMRQCDDCGPDPQIGGAAVALLLGL